MENETDVIRNQMLETRTALTEKLEALQETVVNAVQGTTDSVTETVQNVKDAVEDTVSSVTESVQETVHTVKSTFDIGQHVENHPWAMFGGAVALGYLGGQLLPSAGTVSRATESLARSAADAVEGMAGNLASNGGASYSGAPRSSGQASGPNWVSQLGEAAAPLVHKLEGLAIGTLASIVGKMALDSTPEQFKPQLREFIEQAANTLGGDLPQNWDSATSSCSTAGHSDHEPHRFT